MSTPLEEVLGRLGIKKPGQPERGQYDDIIERHAAEHELDPDFVRAVIGKESEGKPGAVSPKGARGLMQLMPATAERLGVKDPHDPDQNIAGGTRYLRELLDRFDGDVPLALAGYNAGEGAVEKYGRKVPPYRETQDYVRTITSKYKGTGRAQKTQAPATPPPAVQAVLDDLDRRSTRPAATPQTGDRPNSPGPPKPASHASPAPAAPPQAAADSAPAESPSGLAPGSRPPIPAPPSVQEGVPGNLAPVYFYGERPADITANREAQGRLDAQRAKVAKARRAAARARVQLSKASAAVKRGLPPQQMDYVPGESPEDQAAARFHFNDRPVDEFTRNFQRKPEPWSGQEGRDRVRALRQQLDDATAAHRRERDILNSLTRAPNYNPQRAAAIATADRAAASAAKSELHVPNAPEARRPAHPICSLPTRTRGTRRTRRSKTSPSRTRCSRRGSSPKRSSRATCAPIASSMSATSRPSTLGPEESAQLEEMKRRLRDAGGYDRAATQGSEAFISNVFHGVGNLADLVGATDTARYLKARAQMGAEASQYRPAEETTGQRLTRLGFQTAGDLAVLVGLQRATGARLPSVMAGEAVVRSLDKPRREQEQEIARSYLMGELFEGLGLLQAPTRGERRHAGRRRLRGDARRGRHGGRRGGQRHPLRRAGRDARERGRPDAARGREGSAAGRRRARAHLEAARSGGRAREGGRGAGLPRRRRLHRERALRLRLLQPGDAPRTASSSCGRGRRAG
jgi:hypothetical protein